MKRINRYIINVSYSIIILGISLLTACNSNNNDIAKSNIKKYLNSNLAKGASIEFDYFSDLYIIEPKDESNMPKPDGEGDIYNELKIRGTGLYLALGGCSPKILQHIIDNDKKFKEWKTGGKEFVMICFFTGKDKYLNKNKGGLCFRLDSTLNVYKPYTLTDEEKIYQMIIEK